MRDRTVIISDDRIADIVSSRQSEPLSGGARGCSSNHGFPFGKALSDIQQLIG